MQPIDALILAGAPETPDPLAVAEGVPRKVLMDVGGRPMLRWVLQALRASGRLGHLIVLGGEPQDIAGIAGPAECLPVQGGLLDKVLAGLQRVVALHPQAEWALFACGDVPLLTPEAVNWFIDACLAEEADLYYPVVEQAVMEGDFPGSARTYVSLREGRFCGGDAVLVRVHVALARQDLLRELMERRKSPLRQARLVGIVPLLKLLSRRLSIAEAERIGGRALGVRGKAIISSYAELAMDVDKPHHLAIARQTMAARLAEAA
ncbi:MAG: nucleotidyltransferase family protein [Chloroflexi bacterium]|nr:nucleotidyltransferase family protein [Chloroflexota bacterium]